MVVVRISLLTLPLSRVTLHPVRPILLLKEAHTRRSKIATRKTIDGSI
jgi:hypothetical protein